MKTVTEVKKYSEPRIIKVGDAVAMTLSFGGSLIKDRRSRFPIIVDRRRR
jgi:hypothetical protein